MPIRPMVSHAHTGAPFNCFMRSTLIDLVSLLQQEIAEGLQAKVVFLAPLEKCDLAELLFPGMRQIDHRAG